MKGNAKILLGVLRRLADAGSGMPNNSRLAGLLPFECADTYVPMLMGELREAGLLERVRLGWPGTPSSWRLVDTGQVLEGGKAVIAPGLTDGQAQRRCLKGDHLFLSAHKGNRICDACKSSTEFDGAAGEYGVDFGRGYHQARRPIGRMNFA